jgi:hypothetical protein
MSESKFIDLASYTEVKSVQRHPKGRLIKACHVSCAGTQRIEVAGSDGQPTLITHYNGDVIETIDVVCSCGASTTISLEY